MNMNINQAPALATIQDLNHPLTKHRAPDSYQVIISHKLLLMKLG